MRASGWSLDTLACRSRYESSRRLFAAVELINDMRLIRSLIKGTNLDTISKGNSQGDTLVQSVDIMAICHVIT